MLISNACRNSTTLCNHAFFSGHALGHQYGLRQWPPSRREQAICGWKPTELELAPEKGGGYRKFVTAVLSRADEKYSKQYEPKRLGYDFEHLEQRVAEIYEIDREELYLKGRHKTRAEARSLLFYWAVRELGLSGTSLAKRFEMSQPGVVYAVNKGEKIVKEKNYRLVE